MMEVLILVLIAFLAMAALGVAIRRRGGPRLAVVRRLVLVALLALGVISVVVGAWFDEPGLLATGLGSIGVGVSLLVFSERENQAR